MPGVVAVPVVADEPVHWSSDWSEPDHRGGPYGPPTQGWGEAGTLPHRQTACCPTARPSGSPTTAPLPPSRSAGERLRRGLSLLALGGVVAGGITYAPYLALVVVLLAAWLLRSGSLAASSVGNRRNRRGAKWYDGIQLLLAAPWHVVAGLGGTIILLLWCVGIATAVGLLCFAASVSLTTSLGVVGGGFALGLWWGPAPNGSAHRSTGSSTRSPGAASRGCWSRCSSAPRSGLAAAAAAQGPRWTPYDDAPLSDVSLPRWL